MYDNKQYIYSPNLFIMKKNFKGLFGAFLANTPPCKLSFTSRKIATLVMILAIGFSTVWAQETTHANPATVKVANQVFLDLQRTPSNVTVESDSYSNYGPGYFVANKSADFTESWWNFTGTFKSSSSSYSNANNAVGFHSVGSSSSSEFYQKLQMRTGDGRMTQMDFYVTGTIGVGFQWKNGGTNNKYLTFTIYEMDVTGATATDKSTPVATVIGDNTSSSVQYAAENTLNGTKYYHIVVTPLGTSNIDLYGLTFKHAPATTYTITYDANGGSGTMENTTNTVADCEFTYSGKDFVEWNTKADGTGESYAPGDNATKDLDLYAIWTDHVAKYTLVYRVDGVEVGNELVNVSGTPVGIANPTKDCYTFAGWNPALADVTGTDGATVYVDATWTANYSTSATLISDDVVSGKPNVNTVFAASNIVSSITFASGNYEFTSNETKKGYYGYKDKQSGDNMKILVQQGKQVQVLFGNLGSDPTITANGVAQSLDASRATGDNAENTFTYTASAADALISITMGSGTNTLKKVDIVQLYTATRVDAKSDGAGSDPNVAETTLPTPTAVSGWTFTGWIANQDVKDGDETKTAETILPAGTYTLLANTTFTAQWIEVTGTYDITYVSDHGTAPTAENAASVVLAELSESGWAHKGWTADVDVTVDAATVTTGALIANGKTAILASDVTFTAVWKEIFTVTFDSKDGSAVAPVDIEDGASLDAAPDDPTKTDYVFQGWSETDGGAVVADITALSITGDKTLYAIWALDVQVSEIVFSNSFKGWIHNSQVEVFYMEGESAPTITSYAGENLKAEGGVVISGDKIIATGTDDSEIEFALTMTAVTPLDAAGAQTFDGTEGYVKTRHEWTSERKWKMSKDGTDGRVVRGETSMYIFLGAAESVTLDWGAQKVTDDVAVYVNGTFVKNIGKNNNSAIPLTGGNNMVALYSLQTSGDIWLNGLSVVAYVPTTGVTLKEGEDAISSKTIWESTNFTLTAIVTPGNASDKTITWTSSDDAIATVVDGVVTGVAASATPVTITATTVDGISATCEVTVTTAPTPSVEPTIITQPAGANYYEDATIAALKVVATGSGDLSYQWYLGSDEIDGATAATYTPTVSAIGSYVYHCVVTNTEAGHPATSLVSSDATITIAEDPAAIKLLNDAGAINTTDFITGVSANTVNFNDAVHNCATFGSTASTVVGASGLNKYIIYNSKTTQTKIKFVLYNVQNASVTMKLQKLVEGGTEMEEVVINVPSKEVFTTDFYTFDGSANRTMYAFVQNTGIKVLQVKVIDNGTPLKQFGEVGYSINFNKGRLFLASGNEIAYDGLTYNASSNYAPLNNEGLSLASGKSYRFEVPADVTMTVTAANNKKYYITDKEDGSDNETAAAEARSFDLTAGAWYLRVDGSNLGLTKIEFTAPKCEVPVFNALANSDICSGDPYVALDGTAIVSDGGTVTYKWYKDGEATVLAETATYAPTADGSYYVVATNSLAGYTDNVVQSEVVTVTTHTGAAITAAPENVRMDAGETATLAVVATGKNVTYQWYTCDDEAGSNATEIGGATAASCEVTVGTGVQYYKVVVSSYCGAPVEAVVKVEEWTELLQANVTESITWDFSKAVTAETTLPSGDAEIVLANVPGVALNGEFESNKLKVAGTRLRTTYIQAKKLMFHATIPGKVTIEFSNTGDKDYDRILYVNGVETTAKSKNQTHVTYSIVVPAGDVVIQTWEKAAQPEDEKWNLLNIYSLSFITADYTRPGLTVGSLGTICLPSNVPAGHAFGATFYELVGKEPQYGKIVFDEILSGELEAGKPYLFQAQSDVLYCFYGTTIVSDPINTGAMKGTFEDMTLTDLTNIYYFAQKALWSCVDLTSLSVPANRAYVDMDEMPAISESNPAPGVRRITLGVNGQNTATGVENIGTSEQPMKMIIDGQLYIIRGEKTYDAQGKLVK